MDQTSYNVYTSEKEATTVSTFVKVTEVAIPVAFKAGDRLFVRIKFHNVHVPGQKEGYVQQAYRIEQSHVSEDYSKNYQLTRVGEQQSLGEPGLIGLIDQFILKKSRSFHYQMTPSLTDDLVLSYTTMDDQSFTKELMYSGMETDDLSSNTAQSPPLKLLDDEDPPAPSTLNTSFPEEEVEFEPTNTTNDFIPDLDIDVDAFLEKRDYQVFVLNSNEPPQRGDHLIQVGYYVPLEPELGKVIRVLALKKEASSGELVGFMEFDYYIDELIYENGRSIYMLADLKELSGADGDPVNLNANELEAFGGAKSICFMQKQGKKILVIQHGRLGSTASYEGNFSM
ncbi:MAG: hypothetical protein AAF598_07940 [Bacteroidota bacterium]